MRSLLPMLLILLLAACATVKRDAGETFNAHVTKVQAVNIIYVDNRYYSEKIQIGQWHIDKEKELLALKSNRSANAIATAMRQYFEAGIPDSALRGSFTQIRTNSIEEEERAIKALPDDGAFKFIIVPIAASLECMTGCVSKISVRSKILDKNGSIMWRDISYFNTDPVEPDVKQELIRKYWIISQQRMRKSLIID